MSGECDKCGDFCLDCECSQTKLERRLSFLEEEMDKLTSLVHKMNNFIREKFDDGKV